MIDSRSDRKEPQVSGGKYRWTHRAILAATCALVIGVYAHTARSGWLEWFSLKPADTYYNLLVQGFRAGQLSLKKEVPAGLAQLADPYDPTANVLYRSDSCGTLDLSYYKGRFYLYFGVTPALILFWPYVTLTGHYLFHRQAVMIFCSVGFLVSVGLLRAVWRRYFPEVSVGVVAAGIMGLGLATGVPVLLARCDVYEVAVSCGCMLTMLALGAVWCALHEPERRGRWLAAASGAYGLALGARPSLLFGAVVLLVPVVQAWRDRQKIGTLLIAATGPIVFVGLGLMFYNALRFGSPFEFGLRYELNSERQLTRPLFGLHYLGLNFRLYFFEPARWSARFPFVHEVVIPASQVGRALVQGPFGVLSNVPLVWLSLAVPLAWRRRSTEDCSTLRAFLAAVVLFVGIYALTLCLYFGACFRFEVEFLPALVLLAVVGILGLEHALARRPIWRRTVRWVGILLLGFSVAFNLLTSVLYRAEACSRLGFALAHEGRLPEAIQAYEEALRLQPDNAEAHNSVGIILVQQGKVPEATAQYEQALRVEPHNARAHNNLGVALAESGKLQEAIRHFEQALRTNPDYAEAHNNLGTVLARGGRMTEAMQHWEQALRINPNYARAHYNLGAALEQAGRVSGAIAHYEQALRLKPDYAEAQQALARLRPTQ
jgi:tetratricopeptide (TPR) repeat protein